MPDINDIHRFFECNLPEYKRRDVLEVTKFFLLQMGLGTQKPFKKTISRFKSFKDFVCFSWLGEKEIRTTTIANQKRCQNKTNKNMLHSNPLTDKDLMPYGKYKGHKLANVPPEYLLWLLENDKCSESVKKYVLDNKSFLELECNQNRKSRLK